MNFSLINYWKAYVGVTAGTNEKTDKCLFSLLNAYNEPHRHYHNTDHIRDAVMELELSLAFYDAELKLDSTMLFLAIIYHDYIYEPKNHDNEIRSAQAAYDDMVYMGYSSGQAGVVADLICATKHHLPSRKEESYIIDADLGILSENRLRYTTYIKQIRQEYDFVTYDFWRENRAKFLEDYLEREQIYTLPQNFVLNEPAFANMRWELEQIALDNNIYH